MNRSFTHIFFVFVLSITICVLPYSSALAQSQTQYGVSFTQDLNESEILSLKDELIDWGISVIQLNHSVSEQLIQELTDFNILIRSNVEFQTNYELSSTTQFEDEIQLLLDLYSKFENVHSIGLPSFSDFKDPTLLGSIIEELPDDIELNLYHVHTSTEFPIQTILASIPDQPIVDHDKYLFEAPYSNASQSRFNEALQYNPSLILMDWYWFQEAIESESYFVDIIKFSDESPIVLPQFTTNSQRSVTEWPIIVLVLLWISAGIHIRSNPTYRTKIMRYFTFHRFFVDDVMRYRDRSASAGVTLFIQHAFYNGLFCYIMAKFLISSKGLEAFYFHFPYVALFGQNYFSLFAAGLFFTLLIGSIQLIWLYIPSKSLNHFSQVISLYAWIFHLDFIVISTMMILLITQGSSWLLIALAIFHIIIWGTAFILASIDNSKFMSVGRIKYLFNTIGLFVILTISTILFFVFSGYPFEAFMLSLNL